MKYSQEVLYNIDIINQALDSLGQIEVLKNKDFKYYQDEIISNDWIRLKLNKDNSIPLYLEVTGNEIRIDLDKAEEIISLSSDFIKKNKQEVINLLIMIFSSFIKMKYCDKNYIKFSFLDKNNNVLDSIEFYKNIIFSFKIKCQEKVYMPIYSPSS